MSNIVNLREFKNIKRRRYLAAHSAQLDSFIENFLAQNISFDFHRVSYEYQAIQREYAEMAWDYTDLREILAEALELAIGHQLLEELAGQAWFDGRYITRDELLDRCISSLILSDNESLLSY